MFVAREASGRLAGSQCLTVRSSMWPAQLGSAAAEACFPTPFLPDVAGVVTADLYCVG
jgi:hypothetical protein